MSQNNDDVTWANKIMQGGTQPVISASTKTMYLFVAVTLAVTVALVIYLYTKDDKQTQPVPVQQPVLPAIQNPVYATPQGVLVQAPTAAPLMIAK